MMASNNAADTPPRDPHLGLRFWIQMGQVDIAGFRECNGLQLETETQDYIEGGLNTYVHKLPVRLKYQNITLKRGLDEGQDLYRWYLNVMAGRLIRQNISIIVYSSEPLRSDNTERRMLRRWDLKGAFPCKWVGPELNAERGAIGIESLELAHEGLISSQIGDLTLAAPAFEPRLTRNTTDEGTVSRSSTGESSMY